MRRGLEGGGFSQALVSVTTHTVDPPWVGPGRHLGSRVQSEESVPRHSNKAAHPALSAKGESRGEGEGQEGWVGDAGHAWSTTKSQPQDGVDSSRGTPCSQEKQGNCAGQGGRWGGV